MNLSLTEIATLAALLTSLYALYNSIKKTGANKMKSEQEIKNLETEVAELRTRVAVAESCNTKNDKAIGVMQTDLEWIKKGIVEIKELITRDK